MDITQTKQKTSLGHPADKPPSNSFKLKKQHHPTSGTRTPRCPPFPQLPSGFPRIAIRSKSTKISSVYTDGSWFSDHPKGPRSGIGCYFEPKSPHDVSRRLKTSQPTAIAAELQAAAVGLEKLRRARPGTRDYRIYTDCQDVVKLNELSRYMPWLKKMGLGRVGEEFKGLVKRVKKGGGTVEVVKVERGVVAGAHLLARKAAKDGK